MSEDQKIEIEKKALAIPSSLKSLVEALVFASEEPISIKEMKSIFTESAHGVEERELQMEMVTEIISALNEDYKAADRPYRIISIAGGFQFATLKEYAEWMGLLSWERSRRKLSQSALESLAIIGYKQPISKPEIETIRGVNCDYVLRSLLEKDLITITGRAETVGRPLLYGTTREFLMHFGLNSITDLPRPREIEEILGESQYETERRMLKAQEGAEKMKQEAEDFKSRLPHIPKRKADLDDSVQIIPRKRIRDIKVRAEREKRQQEEISFENPENKVEDPKEIGSEVDQTIEMRESDLTKAENFSLDTSNILDLTESFIISSHSNEDSIHDKKLETAPSTMGEISHTIPSDVRDSVTDLESEYLHIESEVSNGNEGIEDSISMTSSEEPAHLSASIPPTEISVRPESHHIPESGRKRKWQTWKEKIQGFIKKLFD